MEAESETWWWPPLQVIFVKKEGEKGSAAEVNENPIIFLSDEVACTRFTMESSTVEAAGVIKLEVVEGRGRCVIAARDVAPGKQQRGCCTFL